jgi:hypothetical protein
MTIWMLCMLIDWRSATQPDCEPRPSLASCTVDLKAWNNRAWDWEERSHTRAHALVWCTPTTSART